jgi:hypothetical protein
MKLFSRKGLMAVAPNGNGQIEQSPNPYRGLSWREKADIACSQRL